MSFLKTAPVFLALSLAVSGLRFQNPVIDNADNPDPGVLLHDGVYYAVSTTNSDKAEKLPIHKSVDLQNWEHVGYVFNETNFPVWSRVNDAWWAPELHKIGNKFHVYVTAKDVKSNLLAIGLATSDSPEGPYTPQEEAFLVTPGMDVWDPTIIQHENQLILVWVDNAAMWVRNLTSDGLSFADDTVFSLMKPDLDWEDIRTEGPWYVYREGYHYMFYSGNNFCSDKYVVGVARSAKSATGPYEKLPYPILVSNDEFKGPGHGSIVRDVDGEGWVFVHHGWKAGAICGDNYRLMFSSSVKWGNDGWPLNITIGG